MDKKDNDNSLEDRTAEIVKKHQIKRIIYTIIFIIGIPLSYPTVFPLGLICTGILLFQNDKKISYSAIFLIIIQIFILFYFGLFFIITPVR